ncbi:MAG: hypothetical protein HWE14_11865 [Flavobacteriia bacterium]|nr:hypothetical protein [Flavobacteriia bacterium]
MRSTHRLLRRNWKILAHYYNNGATEVSYGLLHSEGFIPEYVTGVIVNESTVKYRCYEYTFEIDKEGCIHIDARGEEY